MSVRNHTVLAILLATVLGVAAWGSLALAGETYQHDAIGRLTNVAYANGGSIHYTYDPNGNLLSIVTTLAATAAEGIHPSFDFALGPALPNPGSGPRNILFSTPVRAHVTLRALDVSGRVVATLVDGYLDAGQHNLRFFTDRWGNGVYFYRLEMPGRVRSGRMVVLR